MAILPLSACGGGDTAGGGDTGAEDDGTPEPVEAENLLTEFEFDPDTMVVEPGAEITITLTNNGALEHTYVIMNQGYSAEEPWDEEDEANTFWASESVQPGETATFTFNAPTEPGTYQVVCNIPGHITGGMVGEFVVEE
jgi:uncharacterized cupredoxin-like copper-binding protein